MDFAPGFPMVISIITTLSPLNLSEQIPLKQTRGNTEKGLNDLILFHSLD